MRRVLAVCLLLASAGCGAADVVEPDGSASPGEETVQPEGQIAPAALELGPQEPSEPEAAPAAPAPAAQEPPTFVLIHGWSNDARVWTEIAPLLTERGRCLVVDLPGHGPKPPPEDGDFSLEAATLAVAAAMDAQSIARAVLIGHGAGALVAREFYRRSAERVLGLVIVDGSFASFPGRAEWVEEMARRLAGEEREAALAEMMDSLPMGGLSEFHRELLRDMFTRTPGAVQAATLRATLAPGIYEEDRIAAPVLIVMANAPFWGEEYRAFVQALCPDLRAEWWSGVSHWLMLERPREFVALLDDPRFAPRP